MAFATSTNGLTSKREFDAKRREANRAKQRSQEEEVALSPEEIEQFQILRYCSRQFEDAQKARRPHETFDTAWSLYNGDMWNERRPSWRAAITVNKIKAVITFMQAIMTDNKPRISVEPLVPGSEDAADLLRKLVDRDWDENNMQQVVSTWVLYGLIWGYAFIKVIYDPYADGGRGAHKAVAIPPYKIYKNRTATCIEDAEHIIHVEDVTMGWIRRNFPSKAHIVNKLRGIKLDARSEQERSRDYIQEGASASPRIQSAMNINGNIVSPQAPMTQPNYIDEDRDTVEVAEHWMRDDTLESYERQVVVNGKGKVEPVLEDGLPVMQIVGHKTVVSEIDGQPTQIPVRRPKTQPVMEKAWRKKYPNGRLVVIAAGRVLLRDIPSPYQTDGFPFAMWKDYDTGGFHGQGEPLALRSMAFAVNKLASQLFEILEKTGNPSWKLKKDAGVNSSSIKNKPAMVIPMDDVNALVPLDKPQTPPEFIALYKIVSEGIAEVSGVNDAIRGGMPAANTSFAAVDQLTEAGSAPIRLKVRNMEAGLQRYGKLRIQLIQQFDQGQRPIRLSNEEMRENVVEPAGAVAVQFREYKNVDIQGQIEFKVEPVSSLSTSPANVWSKWLTMLQNGLVDITWWHSQQRIPGWKTNLPRMLKQKAQDAAAEAALRKASKVGGTKTAASKRRQLPPPGNLPNAKEIAASR